MKWPIDGGFRDIDNIVKEAFERCDDYSFIIFLNGLWSVTLWRNPTSLTSWYCSCHELDLYDVYLERAFDFETAKVEALREVYYRLDSIQEEIANVKITIEEGFTDPEIIQTVQDMGYAKEKAEHILDYMP